MKVSIVIPNWNGEKLLRKNLPKVIKAMEQWNNLRAGKAGRTVELLVVDDGSEDGSVNYLKAQNAKLMPPAKPLATHDKATAQNLKLKIVENKKNLGFAKAVNHGVEEAEGEIVVLLNNDVVPEKNFLKYTVPHFRNPQVFAVSFHEPNWSWARLLWKKGFVEHCPGPKTKKVHLSAWASGGSAAFRKSIWQKLGGFDPIYHPFYWEDVDLSYRAWKRGYRVLWEPMAIVHHQHEGTISRFSQDYVGLVSQRNQLLFIWKNITSPRMIVEHKFWLALKLIKNSGYFKPSLAALVKKPQIWLRWFREWRQKKVSDEEILEKFG